jgi:hypothetical protein
VAPARLRVAAGAGLFAASLTIAGPGIAAVAADPGGSGHGHSKPDTDSGRDRGGDRQGRKGSSGEARHDRGNDQHDRGHDQHDRGHDQHDRGHDQHGRGDDHRGDRDSRGGLDRGGKSDVGAVKGTDDTPDLQVAARSIASATLPMTNSFVAEQATPAAPAEVPAEAPAPTVGGGSGGAAEPAVVAPTVTFGNGRAPGFLGRAEQPTIAEEPIPSPVNAASAPAPPAADQFSPAPAAPPALTTVSQSASQRPEFVDRIWAPLRPAFPGGLAFGITGLVIAPLAGMWIGYRQARSAEAADQLADR